MRKNQNRPEYSGYAREQKFTKAYKARNTKKSFLYLPRHSSFTINHTFANLGNTGHNMAQTLVITTVSTTKAHGGRARVAGEIGHIP